MLVDLHRRLSKKKVTFPPRTTKSFPLCFVPWLTCHSLFDFAFGTSGYLVYIPWYLVHVFWDTPNQQWLAGYNKRNKYIHVKNGILHSIYWRFWSPFLQGNFTTCLDSSDVKKNKHWKTSSEKMWSAFIFVVGISIHWMLPFGIDLASNKKYQHAVQVYVSLWWWAICSITAYVPILTSNELMALTVSKKWIQKTLPNWQWHPISITPCDAKFGWKGFCRFARSYAACLLKCQWHPTNCGLLEP